MNDVSSRYEFEGSGSNVVGLKAHSMISAPNGFRAASFLATEDGSPTSRSIRRATKANLCNQALASRLQIADSKLQIETGLSGSQANLQSAMCNLQLSPINSYRLDTSFISNAADLDSRVSFSSPHLRNKRRFRGARSAFGQFEPLNAAQHRSRL